MTRRRFFARKCALRRSTFVNFALLLTATLCFRVFVHTKTTKSASTPAVVKKSKLRAVYLNHDGRWDRDDQVHSQLRMARIEAERIAAIRIESHPRAALCWGSHTCASHLGCQLSHMRALRYALSIKAPYMIVTEDDFLWSDTTDPKYVVNALAAVTKEYRDWDVIGLAFTTKKYKLPKHQLSVHTSSSAKAAVVQISEAEGSGSYLIRGSYIMKLYDVIKNCDVLSTPKVTIDTCWKELQVAGNWYSFVPPLGFRSGTNDVICPAASLP